MGAEPKKVWRTSSRSSSPRQIPSSQCIRLEIHSTGHGQFFVLMSGTYPTIAHALSELVSQQANMMQQTLKCCKQFLDYMAMHPNVSINIIHLI
jgi:hypothetical protein